MAAAVEPTSSAQNASCRRLWASGRTSRATLAGSRTVGASAVGAWLRDSSAPRTAVVCGSFYLAAEALKVLHGGRHG